jgi:hypothetical protein
MSDPEKARSAKQRYRARHREKVLAADREAKARIRKEDPDRVKASKRRYYERNKEKVKAAAKLNRQKHIDRWREYSARYHRERFKADPDYHRARSLKKRYGITLDEFNRLIRAQGNACAICLTPMEQIKRKCVDHCHRTGTVRGVLCQGCNVAIAHLRDDPLAAIRASEYLARHREPEPINCLTQILDR